MGGNGYWTEGNAFNDNRGTGLYINTLGAVSIAFYQTKHNHALGIDIFDFGTGSVTMSGMPKVVTTLV